MSEEKERWSEAGGEGKMGVKTESFGQCGY